MILSSRGPSMRSIRSKLMLSLGLLCCAIAVMACAGYFAAKSSQDDLQTVFLDRVKPLRDLKIVADFYAVNIVDASHKVRNSGMSWDDGIAAITQAKGGIIEHWKAYAGTAMDAKELGMAEEAAARMKLGDEATAELMEILRARDQSGLDDFVKNRLYAAIDPISDRISKLVELQMDVAQQVHTQSAINFAWSRTAGTLALVAALSGVVLAAWTCWFGVTKPLSAITCCMQRLAQGERGLTIPGADRRDEIGTMAATVQVFKDNADAMHRMREEQIEAESRVHARRKTEMQALAERFQDTVGGIVDTVSATAKQLETAAGSLTKTAESTQVQSGIVAAASEQASVNVQGVAAAAEELAATVSEIGRQVQHSNEIAQHAVTQAASTNQRVTDLSSSASRIGDVITLIRTIAGQTNLLALNATIEAARAGEAGKGFAVVAQEVKQLAEQTARATNEISSQVASMQAATTDAVGAINEITETIGQMSEIAGAIAAAVEEQGATTREISRNVMEAAKGTTEVAGNITSVSAGANETGSASTRVLESARKLSTESVSLRSEVDKFIGTVRAA